MHRHTSSFTKRMARCGRYKITGRLMPLPSETNIPYPSSRTSSTTSAMHIYTPNSTSVGDITMYASAKGINQKRHLKPDTDSSNLWLCTLDSPIHQQHFKL